jgi:hypothetical protein
MIRSTNRSFVRLFAQTVAVLCLLVLALGAARAQSRDDNRIPEHLAGTISEYSPSNVSGGPWEVRGKWTLDIHGNFADFSGAVTMETSDYGVTTGSLKDPTMTMSRNPHTHHISMTHALVTVTTSPTGCPTYAAPTPSPSGPVIVITGPVNVTANGQPAPFEAKGPSSLQICIAGGTVKPFSNFGMIFTGTATSHFGGQFFNGVVTTKTHDDHGPFAQ